MSNLTDNVFAQGRQPGDINMVDTITQLLVDAGHPNPRAWLSDPVIAEASGASPKLQQFLINRYWRIQLGSVPENTTAERYCLVDDAELGVYAKLFADALVPAIIRLNLPRPR